MGAAGLSTTTAHRAERRSSPQEKACVGLLKRTCSYVCLATVGFLFLLGVCLLYLPDPLTLEPSFTEDSSEVTLLIWTHPFGRYRKLPDCFELYQIGGCTLTDEGSAYPQADAVIIHHRDVATGAADLPPEPRPRAQKWIWMNYESPTHTPRLWSFEGVFNLTMTYRTDSDIFLPYGYLVPRERGIKGVQNRFAQPLRASSRSHLLRPRLLAWVISNWSESHARVSLYNQLRRYVQVDVFGRSGRPLPEDSDSSSVVRLVRRYQFYLALENSQHTDYITEKLWNAVQAGAVPVVLGPSRQNYERFLPPEAFIHVDDFSTVRGLARYLLMLRRNPARMRRHLDWRGSYRLYQPRFWADHYCAACRAVRRTRGTTDVVQDLTRWFHS
ncbi:alpha-(1,3)-fucosyltransferase 4-like [Pseudoliparis swirei]|uniref:alpha-(1,3)-fucosyltransferase 4-like n=1 Tax=Pseudoliparis swirei TaxID=2059687 RepID=UPI0024BE368B|nr:alpha-(1,3)-fucosyltransferase 4-like [Pseudoliparis swirei]